MGISVGDREKDQHDRGEGFLELSLGNFSGSFWNRRYAGSSAERRSDSGREFFFRCFAETR